MKKNFILLVALLLCRHLLPAQKIHDYTWSSAGSTWFNYSCTGADNIGSACRNMEDEVKVEYPPWIIAGGQRTYFIANGKGGWVASSPATMAGLNATNIDFHTNGSTPVQISSPSGCPNGTSEPWRYEYFCPISAQYITHPTAGTVNVAFVEGENYELAGIGDPTSGCGSQTGDITTGFVCLAWTPNTLATNWGHQYFTDMGPIVWPATGLFLPNGYKSSYGCGNNSSIQADGYLYVFYKDQSYDGVSQEDGRHPGIKVARAPISDALNPHAYQTFYEDPSGGIHWNPSLPAGLNKSNIQSYYTTMGPQGSIIVGYGPEGGRDYTRFAVARVAGKNYYLGVGSYQQNGNIVVTLKYSYDLLHWSDDREIYSASSHAGNNYTYPIFLSADGWTNTSIDEDNFYIIGTSPNNPNPGNAVNKIRVYPYVEPDPDPTPTICYDEWGNQTFCPPSLARQATTGTTATLDNSKGRAPFVYPNPGPGAYRLNYTLKGHAKTQLNVLDLMGRQIQTGSAVNRPAGTYTETVNISGYAKGVYMLELLVNGKKQTFKVIYQ